MLICITLNHLNLDLDAFLEIIRNHPNLNCLFLAQCHIHINRGLPLPRLQSPEAPGDSAGGMLGLLYVCIGIHIHFNYCITLLHEIMIILYISIHLWHTVFALMIMSSWNTLWSLDVYIFFLAFGLRNDEFGVPEWTDPYMGVGKHFFSKPTVVLQGCTTSFVDFILSSLRILRFAVDSSDLPERTSLHQPDCEQSASLRAWCTL